MTILRCALIQQSCSDDKQANLDRTAAMIRSAAASGAALVCTPVPTSARSKTRPCSTWPNRYRESPAGSWQAWLVIWAW